MHHPPQINLLLLPLVPAAILGGCRRGMGVTPSAGACPGGTHFFPPHLMGSLVGGFGNSCSFCLSTAAGDPRGVAGCPPLVWAALGGPKHSLNE